MVVLMIGTGEESLVGLSLGITVTSLPEYPNNGAVLGYLFETLTGMILGMFLGSILGSLIDSIWHINWCGTWLGAWKLF